MNTKSKSRDLISMSAFFALGREQSRNVKIAQIHLKAGN